MEVVEIVVRFVTVTDCVTVIGEMKTPLYEYVTQSTSKGELVEFDANMIGKVSIGMGCVGV